MKNKTSLFIITLCTLVCLLLTACNPSNQTKPVTPDKNRFCLIHGNEPVIDSITNSKSIKIENITSHVTYGLSKATINDSTIILIYRGRESCTMIQLK